MKQDIYELIHVHNPSRILWLLSPIVRSFLLPSIQQIFFWDLPILILSKIVNLDNYFSLMLIFH